LLFVLFKIKKIVESILIAEQNTSYGLFFYIILNDANNTN